MSHYTKISEKRTELEEGGSDVEDYLNNFLEGVRDDVLMIGQISLDEVQEEERRLRDEHVTYVEQQKRLEQLIKQKILVLEEEAKKRIAHYLREKRALMKKMEVKRSKIQAFMVRVVMFLFFVFVDCAEAEGAASSGSTQQSFPKEREPAEGNSRVAKGGSQGL